jgi:simple sugar transport system ATP-binding protein
VLILDAPTVGVDIKAKDAIYAAVRAFADAGMAVILISDEVDEVFDHCERVLVMAEGRMVHSCVPAHSRKEDLEEAVYD